MALSGTWNIPLVASCALHAVAFGAFQGQGDAGSAADDMVRVKVRSVSMNIPRQTPEPPKPVVPPPPPPKLETPKPLPKPVAKAKPKKRRKHQRRVVRSQQPAAPAQPAAPSSAVPPTVATNGGGTVAVVVDDAMPADEKPAKADAVVQPQPFDLGHYGDSLHSALVAHRRYPEEARDEELEGETTVLIKVDRAGKLVCPARVARSSGHRCLDDEALRMVAAAAPFAALPDGYPKQIAEFTVPVRFEFEDEEF